MDINDKMKSTTLIKNNLKEYQTISNKLSISDQINDLYLYIINKVNEPNIFDEKINTIINCLIYLISNKKYTDKIDNLKIVILICLIEYIDMNNKLKYLILLLRRINEYNELSNKLN